MHSSKHASPVVIIKIGDIMVKGFGMDFSQCLRYYGHDESASDKLRGNTPRAEQERILTDYLLKTDAVNGLTTAFMKFLREELTTECQNDSDQEVSLYTWLRKHMFRASTKAYFGTTIVEDYPELEEDFFDLDANLLTCYFEIPRWLAPGPYRVRDRMIQKMTRHHSLNLERIKGQIADPDGSIDWEPNQGCRSNRARQTYYEARDLELQSKAIMDMGQLFGLSSNSVPAAGWMLMHILDPKADPTLYPRVMEEILSARRAEDGTINIAVLVSKPLLLSMIHEVLRLYVDVLVTREMPCDMTLPVGPGGSDKVFLRKDSIVVAPSWIKHRGEQSWSDPAADVFYPERFLTTDPDTGNVVFSTLGKNGKFFPWGGGKTMCPGRSFAKQEVLGSVATFLSDFDIKGVGYLDSQGEESVSFPTLRDAYPGSAMMVMKGDVKVKITRRK